MWKLKQYLTAVYSRNTCEFIVSIKKKKKKKNHRISVLSSIRPDQTFFQTQLQLSYNTKLYNKYNNDEQNIVYIQNNI